MNRYTLYKALAWTTYAGLIGGALAMEGKGLATLASTQGEDSYKKRQATKEIFIGAGLAATSFLVSLAGLKIEDKRSKLSELEKTNDNS